MDLRNDCDLHAMLWRYVSESYWNNQKWALVTIHLEVWIGLARLDEVFSSCDNVIALAIRETARTKLCADFIPSQIVRRIPVHSFNLQFLGPSDGLSPLTQNFSTVPRPGILDIQMKPISHSFCNCKIFTASEYFTYPHKPHGGNQVLPAMPILPLRNCIYWLRFFL